MGLVGADAEQLRALARTLTEAADRLEGTVGEVSGRLSSTAWHGPDADRYRSQWQGESLALVRSAVGALRAAAGSVDRNAAEQEQASAGLGESGGGATGFIPQAGLPPSTTAVLPGGTSDQQLSPLVNVRDFLNSSPIWPITVGTALGTTPVGGVVPLLDALGLASDSRLGPDEKIVEATHSLTDLGGGFLKSSKLGLFGYLSGVAVSQWGDVAAEVSKADFSPSAIQTTNDYIASDPGGAFDAAKVAVIGYVPKLFSNLVPW